MEKKLNRINTLNLFGDRVFWQSLVRVALPIAAQSLMISAVAVADTLMLGGVEQNAMSAVSLATKIQFIQNIIISSLIAAMIVLGAQYWGKKDLTSISKVFFMALRIGTAASAMFFIGCEFFPEKTMLAFTSDEELIRIASEYLRIAAWSYLMTGISQSYLALLKITDHAKDSAIISSSTVVINIVLNGVLIFGLLGFAPLGVQGAAYATLIARIIELIWAVALLFEHSHLRPNFNTFLPEIDSFPEIFSAVFFHF
jgi:Na+-driven multidrug efflux pump